MANKNKNKKDKFDLFSQPPVEKVFSIQEIQKTTDEAILHDIKNSTDEDPDSLILDEVGLNIRKCVEKFGSKKFHTIVQGVIENDPAFEKYFIYKREFTAYHMSINTVSAPVKATKTSSIFVPKALDGYPHVHVLENGKLALEYMLGVYGIDKIREIFTAIITKKPPYDQGKIFSLLDMLLSDHEGKGELGSCRADKDALVQIIDKIRKGLIAWKKYPSLLGIKGARDTVIASEGIDRKNFLLSRIEYWMDMIQYGVEIYQEKTSWEEFSAAYEDKYPNAEWNKKMTWNIIKKQGKFGKIDLFSSEKAPKTMRDLMKEYKGELPKMFQAMLYDQDIITPLLQDTVFDILRNIYKRSPLVKAFHRLEANKKKQITQQFRLVISSIPDIKFDGGYVIFLTTGFSCPKEVFTQWSADQWAIQVSTWVDQRKKNLTLMQGLEVLLKEYCLLDKVSLRKGKELLFISINGEKISKPLSDLYDFDKRQQIAHITDRLHTKKEEQEKRILLAQELATIGEVPPFKRREKNPTLHKRFLDEIILPDPEIDELTPPPPYLNEGATSNEEPLELREVYDKEPVFEDEYSEYKYNFSDNHDDEESYEEEPLELRKDFYEDEKQERGIDEYFLDSGNPLPEELEPFLAIPMSDEVPAFNEEEQEIPPYFLEEQREEMIPVMSTVSEIQEQTQEDIAHYFLYGPDDVIVYSDYEERNKGAYWISPARKPKTEETPTSSSSHQIAPNLNFYEEEKRELPIDTTEKTLEELQNILNTPDSFSQLPEKQEIILDTPRDTDLDPENVNFSTISCDNETIDTNDVLMIIIDETGRKIIDIPAGIATWGILIFYRIVVGILKGEEMYLSYSDYKDQLQEYIWSKFGRVYPREHLVDFLDIYRQVEYGEIDIPLYFDALGMIDFEWMEKEFSQERIKNLVADILAGGEEYHQYYILRPQLIHYLTHQLQWEGTVEEFIQATTYEKGFSDSTITGLCLDKEGEFDLTRMVRMYGRQTVSDMLGQIVSTQNNNCETFSRHIEKLIETMGRQDLVQEVEGNMRNIITFFDIIKRESDREDVYDNLYHGRNIDREELKSRLTKVMFTLNLRINNQYGDELDLFLEDKFDSSTAQVMYRIALGMSDGLISSMYGLFKKLGIQTFINCFASFMATKGDIEDNWFVYRDAILLTYKRSLIRDRVKNLSALPIRYHDGDEERNVFVATLVSSLRSFPSLHYDQKTEKIIDGETKISLSIDCLLIRYTSDQLEQQVPQILNDWLAQARTTKSNADKLQSIIHEYFSSYEGLDILQNDSSYYLRYLGIRRPVNDICELKNESQRIEEIQSWLQDIDSGHITRDKNGVSNPFNKIFKEDDDLPF